MKIVYVGDNRNRNNYGCRATSTALSQIISKDNEIVGRVYGNYTNSDSKYIFFRRWLPASFYKKVGRKTYWKYIREVVCIFNYYLHRTQISMSKYDFVSMDLQKSINNLIKCIPANPILEECDLRKYDFDALVVNGEGSFIFSKYPWRESFVEAMLMYWAKQLGKKVYFMNAMFSGMPNEDINTKSIAALKELFESIDYIGVREDQSYEFAKKYFPNANNVKNYPDALFTWFSMVNDEFDIGTGKYITGKLGATDDYFLSADFTKPYICISASSSPRVGAAPEITKNAYCKLIGELKKKTNMDIYIVHVCDGDNFLLDVAKETQTKVVSVDTPIVLAAKVLANARVYITGRYHPAILASLGGTPCVFMGSNSHKTLSVQKLLNYSNPKEYSEIPSDDDIEGIVQDAIVYINDLEIRKKIKDQANELSILAEAMGNEVK